MEVSGLSGATPGVVHDQSKAPHNRRWAIAQVGLCMTRWVGASRHAAQFRVRPMPARADFAKHLTTAFLSGDWTPEAIEKVGQATLGVHRKEWLSTLVSDVWERTETAYAPPPKKLKRYILASAAFDRLYARAQIRGAQAVPRIIAPAKMAPLAAFKDAQVPRLATPGDLTAWLDIPRSRLDWFADIAGRLAHEADEPLQHYRYSWVPRKFGLPRLIEAPKAEIKRFQRKILREILDLVPPHDSAHGFRKGRSCISYAQYHAGEEIVVVIDLKDFFLSVPMSRVHGLFRCLGYPWAVARLLTGLCSTSTPPGVFEQLPSTHGLSRGTRSLFQIPHLPQGAPTSPAIANLCSLRMDYRLAGLARHLNARYTRYADDLAFSGDDDFAKRVDSVLGCIARVVKDEGFIPNGHKTRVMRRGQRQYLTGLIVNQHVNVPRTQFDALKAILHNCVRFGPEGQNRRSHPDFRGHLNGRITWIENVNRWRGQKLRTLFDKIDWS